MVKKFLMCIAIFLTLNNFSHAAATPIYDYNVESMINELQTRRIVSGSLNLRGKEYGTFQDGIKYCKLNFGTATTI